MFAYSDWKHGIIIKDVECVGENVNIWNRTLYGFKKYS